MTLRLDWGILILYLHKIISGSILRLGPVMKQWNGPIIEKGGNEYERNSKSNS